MSELLKQPVACRECIHSASTTEDNPEWYDRFCTHPYLSNILSNGNGIAYCQCVRGINLHGLCGEHGVWFEPR